MISSKIRQKALEWAKDDMEYCRNTDCENCELLDINPCNHVKSYEHGFSDGFDLGIRHVLELLHEYNAIDCSCCPLHDKCNDDCEIVITKYFKEMRNKDEMS